MPWFNMSPFERLNDDDRKPISVFKGILWVNYLVNTGLIIYLFNKIESASKSDVPLYIIFIAILIIESLLVFSLGGIIASISTNLGLIRQAVEKSIDQNPKADTSGK